jgi:hypothetical protein
MTVLADDQKSTDDGLMPGYQSFDVGTRVPVAVTPADPVQR